MRYLCGKFEETIEHRTFGCHTHAVKEYIDRHNRVAAYVHCKIFFYITHKNRETTTLYFAPYTVGKDTESSGPNCIWC